MSDLENRPIPTLAELSPWGMTVAEAYYASGVAVGIAIGRRREADELAAIQRAAVASARVTANSVAYDVLAERRGEHDRAAAHRALLRERGIA